MKFIEDGLEWSCNTEHSKRHNAQIQYKLFQFDFLQMLILILLKPTL